MRGIEVSIESRGTPGPWTPRRDQIHHGCDEVRPHRASRTRAAGGSWVVSVRNGRVLVGGVVSLSGRYALQGRLAAAGLQQAVADVRSVPAAFGSRTDASFLSCWSSTTGARARVCVGRSTRWSEPTCSSDPMAAIWSESRRVGRGSEDGYCGTMGAAPMTSSAYRVWCRSRRPPADTWRSSSRPLRGIGPRHECLSRWAEAGSDSTRRRAHGKQRRAWACPSSVA